jgi:hypothetical protein
MFRRDSRHLDVLMTDVSDVTDWHPDVCPRIRKNIGLSLGPAYIVIRTELGEYVRLISYNLMLLKLYFESDPVRSVVSRKVNGQRGELRLE